MKNNNIWKGLTLFLLTGFLVAAGFKAADDQYLLWKNVLENPGFENGIGSWTTSGGTLTTTTTAANVASGSVALSFDGSAAAQVAENADVAIPPALYGQPCRLFFDYKGGGTANYTVAVNNGSDLGTEVISAAATNYTTASIEIATCPTSGSTHIEITSAGDGAVIYFDNFWFGRDILTSFGGGGGGTFQTPANAGEYFFSIEVQYSAGTPSTATGGDPDSMVSSYTDTATGDVTINLNSVCTSNPFCTCSAEQGGLICSTRRQSGSSTAVRVLHTSHTGSTQDPDFFELNCRCDQ